MAVSGPAATQEFPHILTQLSIREPDKPHSRTLTRPATGLALANESQIQLEYAA